MLSQVKKGFLRETFILWAWFRHSSTKLLFHLPKLESSARCFGLLLEQLDWILLTVFAFYPLCAVRCEAGGQDRRLQPAQEHHEILLRDVRYLVFLVYSRRRVWISALWLVLFISVCRVKILYMHCDERSGLMAPMIADDVYGIVMKVRCVVINIWNGSFGA